MHLQNAGKTDLRFPKMIEYLEYKPNQSLQKYIDCYWTLETTAEDINPEYEERVIPLGFPEIIIHFGDLYSIKKNSKYYPLPRTLFTGQLTSSKSFKPLGITGILGVKFKPFGAYYFLPEPPQKYVDRSTDLRQIFEPKTINLLECGILKSKLHLEKIKLIENFLLNHFQNFSTNIQIENIVTTIVTQKGNIDIKSLSSQFNSSQSKLERNFKKIIGLTPKKFAQIIRFNEILKEYKSNKDLQSLAHKYEYYDYSHFTKEFSSFSGFSPNQFKTVEKSLTEKLTIEENADFLHVKKDK